MSSPDVVVDVSALHGLGTSLARVAGAIGDVRDSIMRIVDDGGRPGSTGIEEFDLLLAELVAAAGADGGSILRSVGQLGAGIEVDLRDLAGTIRSYEESEDDRNRRMGRAGR